MKTIKTIFAAIVTVFILAATMMPVFATDAVLIDAIPERIQEIKVVESTDSVEETTSISEETTMIHSKDCSHVNAYVDDEVCPDCGADITYKPGNTNHEHTHYIYYEPACFECGEDVYMCECGEVYELTEDKCPHCEKKRPAVTSEEKRAEYNNTTKRHFILTIIASVVFIIALIMFCVIPDKTSTAFVVSGCMFIIVGILALIGWVFYFNDYLTVFNIR